MTTSFRFRPSRFAAVATGVLSLVLGPPHIETRVIAPGTAGYPADAVLAVVVEHHAQPEEFTLRARAETLRDGTLVQSPIAVVKRGANEYSVARQWARGQAWVLVLTAEQGSGGRHGVAEAMVRVNAEGNVVRIDHPKPAWDETKGVPRRISEREIRDALTSLP